MKTPSAINAIMDRFKDRVIEIIEEHGETDEAIKIIEAERQKTIDGVSHTCTELMQDILEDFARANVSLANHPISITATMPGALTDVPCPFGSEEWKAQDNRFVGVAFGGHITEERFNRFVDYVRNFVNASVADGVEGMRGMSVIRDTRPESEEGESS